MARILLILLLVSCAPEPSVPAIASPEVKAAMSGMGPMHSYRILYDETLQVNCGDGWERLRY